MQEAQTSNTTPMRQNAQGHWVPETLIAPADKLRDEVVMAIIAAAREQRSLLAAFKIDAMQQIADFVDLSAEQYGVAWGGTKGNVTLLSFDGRYKLVRAVGEHRKFDERIQAAKVLIDSCIERWSDGASPKLRALVDHAFRVSKAGHIDVNQVLSLRQLNIEDADWEQAMQAIADAIQVTGTSQYLRLYERDGQGRYVQMSLDLAKL
ncbi:DUF3164 family protein [Aeromonas sp. 3925]|uniref:DUF3164 family protein n=1 Tax=Aeromonas genomosp. paramedia TaxID=3086176 RepID=UPI001FFCA3C8|nr:DUF3164 family protein [Aeromonas genomosp. paramedia]MCK2084854.1 DUF3164 family protein [Aeromonas genomosp. paramedia]